jgi:GNAT superfamily N-acetyltransferase
MPLVRTTDEGEAARLRAAGARLARHAHDMVLDLPGGAPAPSGAAPAPPADLRLGAVTGLASRIAPASRAAYGPGHPDAALVLDAEAYYAGVLAGGSTGALVEPASAVLTDPAGEVAASIVVTRLGPERWGWPGGPWVADVFVVPAHQGRGLGRLLLTRAVAACRDEGEARMGLTVTHGNPAERLYAALGFRHRRTLFVLETG